MIAGEKANWAGPTIRDAPFGERLTQAADNHPHVPALREGRLGYIKDELAKRGITLTRSTVQKWFIGEMRPMRPKMIALAEILSVDLEWLSTGTDPNLTMKERKVRDAMADASVNIVAALIQMGGGNPAFPAEDDKRAKLDDIDIYAIIRGANYSFHVVTVEAVKDELLTFTVPSNYHNVVVLAVVPTTDFCFDVFEVPHEVMEAAPPARRNSKSVVIGRSDLKQIKSFANRI